MCDAVKGVAETGALFFFLGSVLPCVNRCAGVSTAAAVLKDANGITRPFSVQSRKRFSFSLFLSAFAFSGEGCVSA